MAITKVTSGLISADASSIDLNIDAGTLYLDVSENRVGIGTTSPLAQLEIDTAAVDAAIFSIRRQDHATVPLFKIVQDSSVSQGAGHCHITSSNRDMSITAGENLDKTKGLYIKTTGEVGIGTTSPSAKLSIGGGTAGNYTDGISLQKSGGNVYGIYPSTNNLEFRSVTGGNHIATFDYFGKVGIGFTSPQARLQVLDQLKVSTSDQSQGVVALGDGSSTQFGVGIARWNGSSNSGGAGGLGYFSQGTVNSGGHFFYTGDAAAGSTTERMRLDASGRLGIGTTSPSYPLHVDRGATGDIAHFEGQGSVHLRIGEASNVIYLSANNGSAEIAFQSNGSERMRIKNTGVINSPPTYAQTTSNSANMVVRSGGDFERSTSSERYKNSITDATKGLAELKTLRPVNYKGNNDGDTVFYGLIAEEVHDAGLTEFVEYDDENKPDALRYPHMVSLCVKAIQEQQTIIEDLKTRIETLESA